MRFRGTLANAVLARFASCARHVASLGLVAGVACCAGERDSTPPKTHSASRCAKASVIGRPPNPSERNKAIHFA
jgi:hypothetical protein